MSSLGLPERLATGLDRTGHATGLQLQLPSIWIPWRTSFNWLQMVYSHNTILGGLPLILHISPYSPHLSWIYFTHIHKMMLEGYISDMQCGNNYISVMCAPFPMNPGSLASQGSRRDSIHQSLSGRSSKDRSVPGFTQNQSKTGHKCSKCSKCVCHVFAMCLPWFLSVLSVFQVFYMCFKCILHKCVLIVF